MKFTFVNELFETTVINYIACSHNTDSNNTSIA